MHNSSSIERNSNHKASLYSPSKSVSSLFTYLSGKISYLWAKHYENSEVSKTIDSVQEIIWWILTLEIIWSYNNMKMSR